MKGIAREDESRRDQSLDETSLFNISSLLQGQQKPVLWREATLLHSLGRMHLPNEAVGSQDDML